MKPSFTRRYRRRSKPARSEGGFFKKEGHSEQPFFGDTTHDAFFQPPVTASASQSIQRKCDKCEQEEKKVHRVEDKKEEDKTLHRATDKKEEDDKKVMRAEDKKEEDKKLQRATEAKQEDDKKLQKKEATVTTGSSKSVSSYVNTLGGKGHAMSPAANQFFGSRMGYDFSNVKLHTDKEAAESARSVNAKAYTIGNNIVFNDGQYDTSSNEGKKLLAHELAHVVQNNSDQVISRKPDTKEDAEKKYGITIVKGDKDWSEADIRHLINSLNRLTKKELPALKGYQFVRWSTRGSRIKNDPTYISPGSGIEECAEHELDFAKGITRISMYDDCFADPEAVKDEAYGIDKGEFNILHEVGHLMQNAELRAAYEAYKAATGDDAKNAAARKVKKVEGRSLKEFEKQIKGKKSLYDLTSDSVEQFAEGYAIFKANPDALKSKNPKLYKWFKAYKFLPGAAKKK